MKLQHIGYFNEIEDLKMFDDMSADEIVYGKMGNMMSVSGYEFCDSDELELNSLVEYTKDGKYAVVNDLPTDLSLLGADGVCDFFIDVYKVISENDITPKQAVTEQIIAMLNNNILAENGNESFVGWCEDGGVFEASYPNESDDFYNECERIMNAVAPLIDKATYNHLAKN
jgi:hypothetical protein